MVAIIEAGTLAGWATVVGLLVFAWVLYRGGGGGAMSALRIANEILEKRVATLEDQAKLDQSRISELTAKTDIAQAIQPLIEAVVKHEEAATDRYIKTGAVLERIANKLDQGESA